MHYSENIASYDAIAGWWSEQLQESTRILPWLERAIKQCSQRRRALDVGCGTGGRGLQALEACGFAVTGLDFSSEMLALARKHHPNTEFIQADLCEWQVPHTYDCILAWDSLFHLPHELQEKCLTKLCSALSEKGVLLCTVGGIDGEVIGNMQGRPFYHSSLSDTEYLRILHESCCTCVLLERDQYPQDHLILMAVKTV
jgi:trans-aconitate methyltransferase